MALEGLCGFRLEEYDENPLENDDIFTKPIVENFKFPKTMPAKCLGNIDVMKPSSRLNPVMDSLHGTTTLGFKFKDGIIVAVDSRATAGSLIASQNVSKVVEISPYLLGTLAGSAADCRIWYRCLALRCRQHESLYKTKLKVREGSCCMAKLFLQLTRMGMALSMGWIMAGWDGNNEVSLFYINGEGHRIKSNVLCIGSGMLFACAVLDSEYKFDMTKDQAIELGYRAIYHATFRDSNSGGKVTVYCMDNNAEWKKLEEKDTLKLHQMYMPYCKEDETFH